MYVCMYVRIYVCKSTCIKDERSRTRQIWPW
jgi:hypothetical protein